MTTLVTGATGFVGAAVMRRLLSAGHAVRVFARPGGDRRNLEGLDIEIFEGDLTVPESIEAAVRDCRFVFHVAADYRIWTRDPEAMMAANVDGTGNLLRAAAAAGAERIVYTSSVATLGLGTDGTPSDETTPSILDDMIGPYKRSKFLAEEEARNLVVTQGAPIVIVNPSTPVGPRDVKPTPTGRVIVEAASGRMPAYVDTGLNIVHVDDVANGHLAALERGRIGERYILGGEDRSLADILALIARHMGRSPPRWRLPHGAVMPIAHLAEAWARLFGGEPFATVDGIRMARKKMFFSSAKAVRELGYATRPAEQAITDAVDWFRAHGYVR